MQQRIILREGKTFGERRMTPLVTLTLPHPLVTFRLKALRVLQLAGAWPRLPGRLGGKMKKTGLLLFFAPSPLALRISLPRELFRTSPMLRQTPPRPGKAFPVQRIQTPTYADLYCAGFINKQLLPNANYRGRRPEYPQHHQVRDRGHRLPGRTGLHAWAGNTRSSANLQRPEPLRSRSRASTRPWPRPDSPMARSAGSASSTCAEDGDRAGRIQLRSRQSGRLRRALCREAVDFFPSSDAVLIASCRPPTAS